MILSRKWLNEFVDVSDISDREFDEAMTLSGSKVETVTRSPTRGDRPSFRNFPRARQVSTSAPVST